MIELRNVTIQSGGFRLRDVHVVIPTGTYSVLMGGTGQGKTTILEAICGLRKVAKGEVFLQGADVTRWKPARRGVGYVPQDLALFPSMTVREHFEFALRLRRVSRVERARRVAELADVLGVERLLERSIRGLSGGESQRVALGRALSFSPRVLLLDEPLNALDESTRDRLCDLLERIQRSEELTVLHVTHSRDEARRLAGRLLVIEGHQVRERPIASLGESTDRQSAKERA
ncbi:MAG: ATP-binding cassette domain-containing protein [Planctomycetes bacterium]|nr:ATP-binding cassette domain-containing protein [Planctomycetota bacterium]